LNGHWHMRPRNSIFALSAWCSSA